MSDLRLDWLENFELLADEGSLTRAARRAGLSQPALHTQIGQLAAWAGAPLYARAGRGVRLTPRGEEVLRLARGVSSEIRRFRVTEAQEPVAVAAGRGTHLYLLAEPLRRWVDEGGALRLRSLGGDEAARAVLDGEADVAVAPVPRPIPKLRTAAFRAAGVVAVVRDGDPLARRSAITAAELVGRRLLLPPPPRPLRASVDVAFAAIGATPTVVVELEGWDLLVHYAALDVGVALVNDYVPVPPGTVGVPVSDVEGLTLRVVMRRDEARPAVRALFERLAR